MMLVLMLVRSQKTGVLPTWFVSLYFRQTNKNGGAAKVSVGIFVGIFYKDVPFLIGEFHSC